MNEIRKANRCLKDSGAGLYNIRTVTDHEFGMTYGVYKVKNKSRHIVGKAFELEVAFEIISVLTEKDRRIHQQVNDAKDKFMLNA